MKYIIILLIAIFLFGCRDNPKEFYSIEICWQNGQLDTLNEKDGYIIYYENSPFNQEMIVIHKWGNFDNPVLIKTDKLRWFCINYKPSDE